MWIIPKQLHTSAYVQDTKGLGQDSEEFSQTCERSLTWRGKDSLQRTWLQRWKRENWMQHLCSRTLKHSHTESFVDAWTSSLAGSRANLLAKLDHVRGLKIPGICSPTSGMGSESADPELFSSKTLKELSLVKRPMENQFSNMSSENWKDWVTSQRQEFSQRVKSAHLIRESESSSSVWRTPQSQEPGISTERLKGQLDGSRAYDKETGRLAQYGLTQQVQKNWATPNTMDHMDQRSPEALQRQFETTRKGRTQPANLREQVHPKNWPTARTSDAEGGRIETELTEDGFRSKRHRSDQYFGAKLRDAVETHEEKAWPTPATRDYKGANSVQHIMGETASKRGHMGQLPNAVLKNGLLDQANLSTSGKSQESWPTPRANKVHPEITDQNREQLANRGKANLEEDVAGHCGKATGKLNPDWVEQLMGLPTGWTDLGSWATESSHQQQPKHS